MIGKDFRFGIRAAGLAAIALAAGWWFGARGGAVADPPARAEPSRIAYVNITEVVRKFGRATHENERINEIRSKYVEQLEPLRRDLSRLQGEAATETNAELRRELEAQQVEVTRQIQDIERNANARMSEQAGDSLVAIYRQIRETVAEMAEAKGLDAVEVYPGANDPLQVGQPALARLVLQAPAGYPIYVRDELELTAEVVRALNRKYPPHGGRE